jgi:hypothetical protein
MAMATPQRNAELLVTLPLAVVKLCGLLAVVGACYFAGMRLPSWSVWQHRHSTRVPVDAISCSRWHSCSCSEPVAELLGFH